MVVLTEEVHAVLSAPCRIIAMDQYLPVNAGEENFRTGKVSSEFRFGFEEQQR
jgi:hypothetical protein